MQLRPPPWLTFVDWSRSAPACSSSSMKSDTLLILSWPSSYITQRPSFSKWSWSSKKSSMVAPRDLRDPLSQSASPLPVVWTIASEDRTRGDTIERAGGGYLPHLSCCHLGQPCAGLRLPRWLRLSLHSHHHPMAMTRGHSCLAQVSTQVAVNGSQFLTLGGGPLRSSSVAVVCVVAAVV